MTKLRIIYKYLVLVATINISCYQCKRNGNSECLLSDLQPCMSNQDICVTHISKMSKNEIFQNI